MVVAHEVVSLTAVGREGDLHRMNGPFCYATLLLLCETWWDCSMILEYDDGVIIPLLPAIGNSTELQKIVVAQIVKNGDSE